MADDVFTRLRAELAEQSRLLGMSGEREAKLIAQRDRLADALRKAYHELNTINARDGVPYTYSGQRSSVSEEYFASVVDEARAALESLK